MGVNVRLQLPYGTRIKDVAKVAAALIGHKSKHEPIGGSGSDSIFANVDGYKLEHVRGEVTLAYIVLDTTIDTPAAKALRKSDGPNYHLLYHFEYSALGPGMLPTSTPVKIALCVELAKFFGGTVDFNDCDDVDVDLEVPAKTDIHASDDPEWSAFQRRILAVKPLTLKDINKYK